MKRCSACNELLPLSAFYKQKGGKLGVMARCKKCVTAKAKSARRRYKALPEDLPIETPKPTKARREKETWSMKPWKARPLSVELFCAPTGQWWQVINDGSPLPATDACVSLWLALKDAEREIERLREEMGI